MATFVVEAVVSESLKLLLDIILSREFVEFFRSNKLDYALFEKLNITLLSLQAVLIDAEEKQITNDVVKKWLVMLQHAIFDAEDLFDQINTDALRCRVKAEHKGKMAKVRKFLSSHFKTSYKTINSEMQNLLERLEHFANKGHLLGLKVGVSSDVWHGTPTSSVAEDESTIYGRDNDLEKLKDLLLLEDASEGGNKIEVSEGVNKIGVVSIVGMGGLGKTTLAKLLYHDPKVDGKFTLKGWAHISKDFNEVKVTKAILESITQKAPEANDLNTLQVKLQESLKGKLFLLVLDDIWDVNSGVWNRLKNIFNVGEAGSRIIITTRVETIAVDMQTFLPIHKLEDLEAEACWNLLAKHAFGASNCEQQRKLKEIGKEIARKCDGLPLAAVALGSLLRTKLSQDHWNDVLKSNIWELENTEVNSTLKPALLFSYHYLPGHLKRCFAYCAIFPKNYKLEKKRVAQLWIAEGLVLQPKSEKSWEKVAEEYFDELVSRSMIHRQQSVDRNEYLVYFVDRNEYFEMHDLMNDLATTVSSPYCMRLDEHNEVGSLEIRHLSFNPNAGNSYNKFDRLCGWKGIHTFLSLPSLEWINPSDCISDKTIGDFLREMEHLHLLSLARCHITKVPTSIGNLIYLRYLNLSATSIVRLPSETSKLVNLQTLIVSQCRRLTELPEDMGKLVSLRNLDVSDTPLREIPVQIVKLKNLQTLSNYIVSKQCDGLKVGDLEKLPHLRGNLSISELQNVVGPSDASPAYLLTKKQIEELTLKWHYPAPSDSDLQIQSVVLEQLQPAVNLKSLTIDGYGGTNFPNWLGDSSYGNMVYLEINNCDNCSRLPPLGQLGKLKELSIYGIESVKSVGAEFYGNGSGSSFKPFPSLETLSFKEMPEWEEWNLIEGTITEFPTLRRLTLRRCPKLKGKLPISLPSLIDLYLVECPLLVEALMNMEAPLLPTSLVTLKIRHLGDIECLDGKWLHHLTSLQYLEIWKAPNLKSLPEEGFPSSLSKLIIDECPLLEAILQEKQGKEWNKIAHIPSIIIDFVDIKRE